MELRILLLNCIITKLYYLLPTELPLWFLVSHGTASTESHSTKRWDQFEKMCSDVITPAGFYLTSDNRRYVCYFVGSRQHYSKINSQNRQLHVARLKWP